MEKKNIYDFILKVHSIAKIGLIFSKDEYALENYNELNNLSLKMLEDFENVNLGRNNYFERDVYPTPNISNRTVIINDKDEILLVREDNSNTYSIPGGWCDLYDSPSEAARNEVSQEAGAEINIKRLVGILHRTPFKVNKSVPEYVVIFEGELKGKLHEHTHETNDVKYFPINNLPEMSRKLTLTEIERIIKAVKKGEYIYD